MDEAEVVALRQRVADLEARLPHTEVELPLEFTRAVWRDPEPPVTRKIAEVALSGALRSLTIREVRQVAVAVALSRGALSLPGAEVPADYTPDMVRLAEARADGLTWRAALVRCGFEVPDDVEVREQARSLRGELRGLWDGVLPVLGELERRLPNWQHKELVDSFRELLV